MKLLIIRFSSIGDVTQTLSVIAHVRRFEPEAEIHFLTRSDMADLLDQNPHVKKVWTISRDFSVLDLYKFFRGMRDENFTHIYDAHNNLRSRLARWVIGSPNILVNKIDRLKRFLLLNFRINKFEKPLSGQRELLKPLNQWGFTFSFPQDIPTSSQIFVSEDEKEQTRRKFELKTPFVALVPTAAYALKRWPIESWKKLIEKNPELNFVVLAGPDDNFVEPLAALKNVKALAGATTLRESISIIALADAVVANDTGLMHIAEQLSKPTLALMGPAPFGFPSRSSTRTLELDLTCRPCSKHGQGPCTNKTFQACLVGITPDFVHTKLKQILLRPEP